MEARVAVGEPHNDSRLCYTHDIVERTSDPWPYLPCFSEAERDAKDKVSRYDEFWRAGINRDCLFQLGPVHEVYSADQAGEGTNVKIEGGVSIGMGQTNLQLDEQLERGTFMYKGDLFELAPNDWKYGALRGTVGPVEIFALNSWTQGYVRSL